MEQAGTLWSRQQRPAHGSRRTKALARLLGRVNQGEDPDTKVICLFLEEISDPVRFVRAAEEADRAGQPIVAVKVGSSDPGQAAALAHARSVAGDDAVVDSVLRQPSIIRVTGIEELLSTGAMLAYNRWPAGRRLGVVTASGRACDIICDAASAESMQVPDCAPEQFGGSASCPGGYLASTGELWFHQAPEGVPLQRAAFD